MDTNASVVDLAGVPLAPPRAVATTCPYCGVGCGVDMTLRDGRLLDVQGSTEHPANRGRLCVKGTWLHESTALRGRLTQPLIRGKPADWDSALDLIANYWRKVIDESGPDAVAIYGSGQLLSEDYYVANKLMKGFIGSGNMDTNSRLCMASAVVAYQRAFGADAVPCCYEDLEVTDLLILAGWNPAWTHPVLYQRIAAAKAARPELKIVVIDPRRTASVDIADLHLQLRPGTDAALFNGLLNAVVDAGALSHRFIDAHTNGLDACKTACAPWSLEHTADFCELPQSDLQTLYNWFINAPSTVTCWSQGLNQSTSGVNKGEAIINLHLATGRIGSPGSGPFSITGQPNAMGGREVGGLATQLAAHMQIDNPEHQALAGRFWNSETVARRAGYKAVDLFEAMLNGHVRAVWIAGTNPVASMPDSARVRQALRQCELVVVADCIADTDTARLADVVLPALTWGEKDGTATNSERCISRQRGRLQSAGDARPDWWMFAELGKRLGFGDAFAFNSPAQIFREHAALSGFENDGKRAFDIVGLANITDDDYESLQPVQWPVTASAAQGTARLFADGRFFTGDGRARFAIVQPEPPREARCNTWPLLLNTGRLRDQWHTMARTGSAPRLLAHIDRPWLYACAEDIECLGLVEGEVATVSSPRGSCLLQVRGDDGLRTGELFAPMHWNGQYASSANVGRLIAPRVDALSGQPELKQTAVMAKPFAVTTWARLVTADDIDPGSPDYWVRIPHQYGLIHDLAVSGPFDWQGWLTTRFGQPVQVVQSGSPGEDSHWVALAQGRVLGVLHVAAAFARLPAIESLMAAWQEAPVMAVIEAMLADDWARESGSADMVCACFRVNAEAIKAAIADGCDCVQAVGDRLKCGTRCGSCKPEINGLLRQSRLCNTPEGSPLAVGSVKKSPAAPDGAADCAGGPAGPVVGEAAYSL
ncbi:MAG: molybdopterin-dependent oxidoreductase [Gammaproteobacteria bacterium]|nr:molybdopterin-dependent oxidoreductase [Gammaproteobacteria bacterium]